MSQPTQDMYELIDENDLIILILSAKRTPPYKLEQAAEVVRCLREGRAKHHLFKR